MTSPFTKHMYWRDKLHDVLTHEKPRPKREFIAGIGGKYLCTGKDTVLAEKKNAFHYASRESANQALKRYIKRTGLTMSKLEVIEVIK